jgi:hypothetical protein
MDIETARYTSPLPDTSSWFTAVGSWIADSFPGLINTLKSLFGILVGISFPLALFFLIGIIYCVEKLKKIRLREEEIYDAKVEEGFETAETGDTAMAHRWQSATNHIASDNPNDWKQAIIEADIILEDLLTKMGYRGDSIGEKLKRVAKGDMKSLNEAWEAHKVRNQIAHEGSSFTLNHHEAKNVIGMYRKVFEEFYYI